MSGIKQKGKVLLTGGLGYIGSHTAVALIDNGWDVVIIDNLVNSKPSVLGALETICKRKIDFIKGDCCIKEDLDRAFTEFGQIYAVIHFAGYKAVGESVEQPLKYYQNNLESALETISAMNRHKVSRLIFSSSATVYGNAEKMPIDETFPLSYTQPYGETKLMIENMVRSIAKSDKSFKSILLRYFNPVGAHESGLIGEDPNGRPNNLMPYITRVALGKLEKLTIYGNDYPTPDGTCIRDFIHVMDLAEGHVAALSSIEKLENNIEAVNLGTGKGVSVKEMVDTFNKITGGKCKAVYGERRAGDVPISYANADKAKKLFSWSAKRNLYDMCSSAYEYEKNITVGNKA